MPERFAAHASQVASVILSIKLQKSLRDVNHHPKPLSKAFSWSLCAFVFREDILSFETLYDRILLSLLFLFSDYTIGRNCDYHNA